MVTGITGGMGSGKSTVSRLLRAMGYAVFDSDEEAKFLINSSLPLQKKLTETFGESIFDNGTLNKAAFAALIFSDSEQLKKANSIIHPEVKRHFAEWLSMQKKSPVFIESAILFESNFDQLVDKVLLVYAPQHLRLERALMRGGEAQRHSIEQRMAQQIPDEEKIKLADFIVENDGNKAIIPQVEQIVVEMY